MVDLSTGAILYSQIEVKATREKPKGEEQQHQTAKFHFLEDTRFLVAIGDEGQIWDAATGQRVHVLHPDCTLRGLWEHAGTPGK